MSESVKEIFKADNVPIEWEQVDVSGVETGDKHSEELFRESIASLKRNKLGLKGMGLLYPAALQHPSQYRLSGSPGLQPLTLSLSTLNNIGSQAFCIPPSSAQVISLSTWLYVKS